MFKLIRVILQFHIRGKVQNTECQPQTVWQVIERQELTLPPKHLHTCASWYSSPLKSAQLAGTQSVHVNTAIKFVSLLYCWVLLVVVI